MDSATSATPGRLHVCLSDRGSHVFACSLGARQWAEPLCTGVLLTAALRGEVAGPRRGEEGRAASGRRGSLSLLIHPLFLWALGSPSQPSLGTQPYSEQSSHLAKVWCWPLCWRGIPNSPAHAPPGPERSPCLSPSPWTSLWALLHASRVGEALGVPGRTSELTRRFSAVQPPSRREPPQLAEC